MSTEQLFIPDKIKVGFQNRKDTYTGKLAYVIYFDGKGVLRKEASWTSWRDEKIEPLEFANTPLEGFVLNKGVGGARQSYGWNARNEYIRVYDPRDFEFEISVANLLFILRECDCNKGKGLEGQFVYSWSGTELVLLPVTSQDFQKSRQFTDLQAKKVKAKELIPGATYLTKRQETLVYLGRFDCHYLKSAYYGENSTARSDRKHVFWNNSPRPFGDVVVGFCFLGDLKPIATLANDTPVSNYAELVQSYHQSQYGTKVVRLFLKQETPVVPENGDYKCYGRDWAFEEAPGVFATAETRYTTTQQTVVESVQYRTRYQIVNGAFISWYDRRHSYPPGTERTSWRHAHSDSRAPWVEPTPTSLYAELESGAEYLVRPYGAFGRPW